MSVKSCAKILSCTVENAARKQLASYGQALGETQKRFLKDYCVNDEFKCPEAANKKKMGFWKRLFARKPRKKVKDVCDVDLETTGLLFKKRKIPPVECCRVRFYAENKEDPDLSSFGGKAYRTCGKAYIVQRDLLPVKLPDVSQEDMMVKKIETHPDLKELLEDPLPHFKSAAQRMIDQSDRRLHPLYKMMRTIPRNTPSPIGAVCPHYKVITGPISITDIPMKIKFNKSLLEQKNIYSEYKRVSPPKDVLGRMVEMRKNQNMTMADFAEALRSNERAQKKKKRFDVFDTLAQNNSVC